MDHAEPDEYFQYENENIWLTSTSEENTVNQAATALLPDPGN